MAQDIVSGLFGASPWQIEQQRNQQLDQQAFQYAQLDPMKRAAMGMYRSGARLGGMLGGALGMVDPQVEEAKARQAALSGLDVSSPETIMQRAQQIQDPQLKIRLMMMARQMEKDKADLELTRSHAKYYEQGGASSSPEALAAKLEIVRRQATEIGIKKLNLSGAELDAFVKDEVAKAAQQYATFSGKAIPNTVSTGAPQIDPEGNIILSPTTSIKPGMNLTAENKAALIKDAVDRGDTEAAKKIAAIPVAVDPLKAETERAAARAKGTVQGRESAVPNIDKDTLDFYASQYLQGDTQWQAGLGRTSEGAAVIRAVKLRAPELAAEMGMKPTDVMANRQEFQARVKALKDFSTGKQGDTVRAINTAVDHLDTLYGLGSALKNKDTQAINYIANKAIEWSGGAAPVSFDLAKQIIAEEIVKSIVPGGGGVSERQQLAEKIRSASSPEQLDEGIKTFKKLMAGQLNSLRLQYKQTTKRDDFDTKLLPASLHALFNVNAPSVSADIPTTSGQLTIEERLAKYPGAR